MLLAIEKYPMMSCIDCRFQCFYNQISTIMKISNYVDPTRFWQLLSGVLGIYVTYLVTGVVHQSMLKEGYKNDSTGAIEKFTWPSGFLIFPCGVTWIIGSIVNHFTIKESERTNIPNKNSAICAITVSISTLTYTYAIYMTNFPVVMMFKSCNLISVILVGVLCSRVKDKKLSLATKKIVIGVLITIGIVMFKAFDPSSKKEEKKTEIMGIVLLIVSLLADGFLPDFQAEIKSVYKPLPMEMMTQINKWVAIVSIVYSTLLLEIGDIVSFILDHSNFAFHMALMGILSTFGQMFVYRMIKQFKQHFAPFVITTRKIFTVGLSIFWYGHPTNIFQMLGLFLVFALVTYEFVSQLMQQKTKEAVIQNKPVETSLSLQQVEQIVPDDYSKPQNSSTEVQDIIKQNEKQLYQKKIVTNPGAKNTVDLIDAIPSESE